MPCHCMHAASEFRDVINRMDKDGNGIIDADELLSCAKDMVRNNAEPALCHSMRMYTVPMLALWHIGNLH